MKKKLIEVASRSASFGSDAVSRNLQKRGKIACSISGKLSQAIAVLVGGTDFLSKPVVAFVRLAHSQELGNMTEVPLPVKFLFIMLGPQKSSQFNYHEVGRAVATLMNNKVLSD